MTEQQKIDELVNLLDGFMEKGGGHMNVQVNDSMHTDEVTVETFNSQSCSRGNLACAIPNLYQGMDETIDETDK